MASKFGFVYKFKFCHIALKQLNSVATIATLSWLGDAEITHLLWVQEFPVPFLAPARIFMFYFCFVIVVFLFIFSKNTFFHHKIMHFYVNLFSIPITYCKIGERLWVYKFTDLVSWRNTPWTYYYTLTLLFHNLFTISNLCD